jgi:hypothetical protein
MAIAAVFVIAVLVTRLEYVPIWDGRIYAACMVDAGRHLTLASLRCGGHPSQAYVAIAAIAQLLAPASPAPGLITNAGLFLLACFGFHRLVVLVFPRSGALDRALLTAAFAVHPAFLASVVQPGLDLPLVPAFIWSIVFAIQRRWFLTVLVGLGLAFTKETGVLLYAVLLACYGVWFELRPPGTLGQRVRRAIRLAPAAFPGVAFAAYLYYRATLPNQAILWHTGTTNDSLLRQFLIPRLDLYQVNYAVLLLVLNFAWILTVIIALDAFVGTVRAAHREPSRSVAATDQATLGFLVLLTIVSGYALTRFSTFGHSRYFLTITALLFIPFYASLLRLVSSAQLRRAILAIYGVLLAASVVRTVDPLSRRLYGTFEFGSHRLLRMTRVTGECCGAGQDQLVYNLQFTALHDLVNEALVAIAPRDSMLIVVPDTTGWILIGSLDRASHRRTLATENVMPLDVREPRYLAEPHRLPARGYYFALPNGDDRGARAQLARSYVLGKPRRFEHGGYALLVYELTRHSVDSRDD